MRRITDHRLDEGGFDEAARGLVRNAPWWMTSLLVHAAAAIILWHIPFRLERNDTVAALRSDAETRQTEIEEPPPEDLFEPVPDPPEVTEFIEAQDPEQPETDTDSDEQDTAGEQGDAHAPYAAAMSNAVIGPGPGGGGGPPGRGGKRTRGGGPRRPAETEIPVDRGLEWLAIHQDEDGKWDCDGFMKHDPAHDRCDGAGGQLYDTGVSGLALLAFLGAGYTDRGSARENPYARTVRTGLRYLIASQDDDGVFGTRATHAFMYNHAIATLAMCEAYWMTHNPRYKRPAQDGLNFIIRARNPYLAWRYEPRGGENDTSVTGWCIMALKSGKYAGLEVDPDAFEGARQWIEKMTDPNFGQVGYNFPGGVSARPEGKQGRFPAERTQAMTAAGMLTRIFLGEDPRDSVPIRRGAALCADLPPVWNPDTGDIDMYYWYYGTLAMFQVGGAPWRRWNEAMKHAIVNHQHGKSGGARAGSWDPIGCWGDDGGRVYATATMVMCLEVYYRYDKVFGAPTR